MRNDYLQSRLSEYPPDAEIILVLNPLEDHLFTVGAAQNIEYTPEVFGGVPIGGGKLFISGNQSK